MSKLSTPLLVIFAVAAVAGLGGWCSSAKKCSIVTGELITTSNKLAEATAKLAEQGATSETLRTQLTLHKSDLASANNQIANVSDQLGKNAARMNTLQETIGTRDAQINTVTRTNVQLIAIIKNLETQATVLSGALDSAQEQIAATAEQLNLVMNALNESQSTNASLLAKLNDPSVLRAQLRKTPPYLQPDKIGGQLVLNPDGTVEVVKPPEVRKFPSPEGKGGPPVFSDPPPASTNRQLR